MTVATLTYEQSDSGVATYSMSELPPIVDGETIEKAGTKPYWNLISDVLAGMVRELPRPTLFPEEAQVLETKGKTLSYIRIERNVKPLLTGDMLKLFETLKAIAITKARSSGVGIKENRLRLFKDPEENTSKIVFEVTVYANPPQAMAYWDALGRAVDSWRERLSSYLDNLLISRWSFIVNWSENESQ